MKAFYAGIIIGLGAAANLAIGGLGGAIIFSFGLLLICALGYDLFTGKVGATVLGEYDWINLVRAYFLNVLGILLVVGLTNYSPMQEIIRERANAIALIRASASWISNLTMGIFCGMCV